MSRRPQAPVPQLVSLDLRLLGRMEQEKLAYTTYISRELHARDFLEAAQKYLRFLDELSSEWEARDRSQAYTNQYQLEKSLALESASTQESMSIKYMFLSYAFSDSQRQYYAEEAYKAAHKAYDGLAENGESKTRRLKFVFRAVDEYFVARRNQFQRLFNESDVKPTIDLCRLMQNELELALEFFQFEPIEVSSVFPEEQRQQLLFSLRLDELRFYLSCGRLFFKRGCFEFAAEVARYAAERAQSYLDTLQYAEQGATLHDLRNKNLNAYLDICHGWFDANRCQYFVMGVKPSDLPALTAEQIETYIRAPLQAVDQVIPKVKYDDELMLNFIQHRAKFRLSLSKTVELDERLALLLCAHDDYLQALTLRGGERPCPHILHMLSTVAYNIASEYMMYANEAGVDSVDTAFYYASKALEYATAANDLRKIAAANVLLAEISTHPLVKISAVKDSNFYLLEAIKAQIAFMRDVQRWRDPHFINWVNTVAFPRLITMFFDTRAGSAGSHTNVNLFRLYTLMRGLQHTLMRLCDRTPDQIQGQDAVSLFAQAASYQNPRSLPECDRRAYVDSGLVRQQLGL